MMATTKHAPATPLPWTAKDGESLNPYWTHARLHSGDRLVATVELTNGPAGDDGPVNFAYLQHAANAYPKLVEALRSALAFVRAEAKAEVARGISAMDGHACNEEQRIVALLRKLGEAA